MSLLGNCCSQPLPRKYLPRATRWRAALAVFILYNYLVGNMYRSVVMSILTKRRQAPRVETLHDLLRPQFADVRVIVRKSIYVDDYLKSLPVFEELKDRVDYRQKSDGYSEFLLPVLNGTHVLIDDHDNFRSYVRYAQQELGDCSVVQSDFRASREPLRASPIAWMIRKGLAEEAELLNKKLMWLEAFGLCGRIKKNEVSMQN